MIFNFFAVFGVAIAVGFGTIGGMALRSRQMLRSAEFDRLAGSVDLVDGATSGGKVIVGTRLSTFSLLARSSRTILIELLFFSLFNFKGGTCGRGETFLFGGAAAVAASGSMLVSSFDLLILIAMIWLSVKMSSQVGWV